MWTTSQGLKEYFTSYGGVKEASVVSGTDPMTGETKSRGFGFVVFEDPNVCEEVIKAGRLTIDQKSVEVKPVGGEGGEPGADPCKCFAGGLPASCDSAKLREYFSKFDPGLTECNVLMDPTGKSRCFGYVTFSDAGAARSALDAKDTHYIDGKWIDLKVCQPKGKGKKGKGKDAGFGKGFGKGAGYGGGYGKGGGYTGYGAQGGYGGYEQQYAQPYGGAGYGGQAYAAAAYAPTAYAAPAAYAQPDYSQYAAAAAAQQAAYAAPQQAYAAPQQYAQAAATYATAPPQAGAAMYARQAPY